MVVENGQNGIVQDMKWHSCLGKLLEAWWVNVCLKAYFWTSG
jgi:hypothetical protein